MKFYKVHSAKFKGSKVVFVPEQFDEIGPDAFVNTNFEFVILSYKVKTISAHAFSGLRKCGVYIPKTTTDIDSMAFEDMDMGNVFYCEKGCVAYNMCTERTLSVNENIEEFIALAEKIKRQEDAFKKKEPKERPLPKKKPDVRESEDNNEPAMSLEVKHQTQETSAEESQIKEEPTPQRSIDDFEAEFGCAPIVDYFSPLEESWKKAIEDMDNSEILNLYDHGDYCEHYRYLCYMELQKRFMEGRINPYNIEIQESVQEDCAEETSEDNPTFVPGSDVSALLGTIPIYSIESGRAEIWKEELKEFETREVLTRYYSEEYCEEYRYLCYMELICRDDTMDVLFSD